MEHGVAVEANVDVAVFFLVGLLGGAHCVGMCGPLVTAYSEAMREGPRDALSLREVRQHLAFNLGRTASYAAIGAAFGLVGYVFGRPLALGGFDAVRGVLGVAVGVLILAFGVNYATGRLTDVVAGVQGFGVVFERVHSAISGRVNRWVDGPGVIGLGALHGLLPCPILYPAYVYVLVMGAPVRGAVYLAALGLGTLPSVFLYGTLIQAANPRVRLHLHRALGVVLVVMGYVPLSHGLMLLGFDVPGIEIPFYQPLGGGH
ncbi:MAG: sulfite exporter TauE/SafE family protein [Halobacteriota archaeon]